MQYQSLSANYCCTLTNFALPRTALFDNIELQMYKISIIWLAFVLRLVAFSLFKTGGQLKVSSWLFGKDGHQASMWTRLEIP